MFAGSLHQPILKRTVTNGLTCLPAPAPANPLGYPRQGQSTYKLVPVAQDIDQMVFFNNPNKASFPAAVNPAHLRNQLGYRTYVQFMMDWGRDRSPEITMQKTPTRR